MLHVFNPEHDIALAANLSNFTAPHAGRQLRHDLGFLPALWAETGDAIAVDDPVHAGQAFRRLMQSVNRHLGVNIDHRFNWVAMHSSAIWQKVGEIDVWGWDGALRSRLMRCGADKGLLPSDAELNAIRQLSHRRVAARLLPLLRREGTVGEAFECTTIDEVFELLQRFDQIVLKAPWSSSGRGIRFLSSQTLQDSGALSGDESCTMHMAGWLRNLLQRQGSVMVEPYYKKVKDFGMEFVSDGCGNVAFLGLSLFHTANGAYTGNIIATEAAKRDMMSHYLPLSLLDDVKDLACRELGMAFSGRYRGPFGIDMMVVRQQQFLLHPCVEINLRRTMGHAALALAPADDDVCRAMRIEYVNGCYKLKICRI